jgi:hypothetical protein
MRKILPIILSIVLILATVTNSYAGFPDVPTDASYLNALDRLSVLGIMGGNDKGMFMPDDMLTREQFAKIIVVASGLESDANALKGSTVFADIPLNAWSSGYINVALNKGFITGMPDGKFHPDDKVTFAQACTVLVKALGYMDQDLKGYWPNNYIEKAKTLNLVDGVALGKNDGLPRWAAAVMINSLLSTAIKKSNPSDLDKTFAEASGLYSRLIYMGDSGVFEKLSNNQILTDKGIFYLDSSIKGLEPGNQYEFYIKDDRISKVFNKLGTVVNITVESALDNRIMYRDTAGKVNSMTLPDKTVYYYNGNKQTYDNLKNILQSNTSMIFSYNENKDAYDYALIFDPQYSKPEMGSNLDTTVNKIGSIDLMDVINVLRNGEQASIEDIEDKDLVYKITDIWGENGYLFVCGNRIEGKFKAFLPSRVSPKQIQIDSKTYELSKDMNLNMITSTSSGFYADDDVVALLGSDGKVVNILHSIDDGTNFAFVLNYSVAGSNSGTIMYSVKLLYPNNQTETRRVDFDPSSFKGKLVTFKELEDDRIYLNEVQYTYNVRHTVNREEKQIDSSYVAEDAKIFNLISNDEGMDAQVSLIKFADIPYGTYDAGKILYFYKTGDFEDISMVVTNDILNEKNKLGVIKKTDARSSIMLINGKEYSYNSFEGLPIGTVFEFSMKSNGIENQIDTNVNPADSSSTIDAIDSKRIKLGNNVYRFRNDISIYLKDFKGDVLPIGVKDLDITQKYGKVEIYTDDRKLVRLIMVSDI